MSLSPAKAVILENLLLNGNPVKPAQIAKETGNQLNSTMMHLIWLVRAGYAVAPGKGQYTIADKGKQVLGIPETTARVRVCRARNDLNKEFRKYMKKRGGYENAL